MRNKKRIYSIVALLIFAFLLLGCSDHSSNSYESSRCQYVRKLYLERMSKCSSTGDMSECGAANLLKQQEPQCF